MSDLKISDMMRMQKDKWSPMEAEYSRNYAEE